MTWDKGKLAASLSTLLKASLSQEGKSHGFLNAADYLANTRVLTPPLKPSRAQYDAHVFNTLVAHDNRLREAQPALEFTSSLNKMSCTLDLGAGPFLVLDLHLESALEDLTKVYFSDSPVTAGIMIALRQLAENYVVAGNPQVAAVLAATASAFENDGYSARDVELPKACLEVQSAYVIAHELGHLLWLRDGVPTRIAALIAEMIEVDARIAIEVRKRSGDRAPGVADPYGPTHVDATIRRRSDPAGEFIQEIWADFYAWSVTAREYTLGGFPPHTVFQSLGLALRNLATIDALRRLAEKQGGDSTVDEVTARRHILLTLLQAHFGKDRGDDRYVEMSGIPAAALASADFSEINQEIEDRYHHRFWNPMMQQLIGILLAVSNKDAVAPSYAKLQAKYGDEPAELILQSRPVHLSDLE